MEHWTSSALATIIPHIPNLWESTKPYNDPCSMMAWKIKSLYHTEAGIRIGLNLGMSLDRRLPLGLNGNDLFVEFVLIRQI